MTKENWKQALIAILIGAGVAFFSTLFEGLAEYLKAHTTEVVSGGTSSFVYMLKRFRV